MTHSTGSLALNSILDFRGSFQVGDVMHKGHFAELVSVPYLQTVAPSIMSDVVHTKLALEAAHTTEPTLTTLGPAAGVVAPSSSVLHAAHPHRIHPFLAPIAVPHSRGPIPEPASPHVPRRASPSVGPPSWTSPGRSVADLRAQSRPRVLHEGDMHYSSRTLSCASRDARRSRSQRMKRRTGRRLCWGD